MILVIVVFVVMMFMLAMIKNLKENSVSSKGEGQYTNQLSLNFYNFVSTRVRVNHVPLSSNQVFPIISNPLLTYKFSATEVKTSKHSYTVGKIEVYLSDIIGHGSEGTVVFK